MRIPAIVLIAAALLLAAACSKRTMHTSDGQTVTVDQKSGQMTIEGKDGKGSKVDLNVGGKGVPLPADFPKDVPIHSKQMVQFANTQGDERILGITVAAPAADTLKFYQEELKKQGWTVDAPLGLGAGFMLRAAKGDRECSLMINPNDKETFVQMSLSPKR